MSFLGSIGSAIGSAAKSVGGFLGTATGSTLAGIGSNLLTNVFNKSSQDSANKTNMQIAQMNNEWSEKMMQKQMDYNTEMWNKTNEYNSAVEQRKRLEEAGLNPSLMMNGGSAGTAQSGSSVGLPSPSTPTVQPTRYDFSGIGQALQTSYVNEGLRAQADAKARVDNANADWFSAKALAELTESFLRSRNTALQNKGLQIQNKWADDMLGINYINEIRRAQSAEVAIYNSLKQGVLLDRQIARYDEETNARIADMVASAALKRAQGRLSDEQLKTQIEETFGKKLDNKQKEAIFDYVVDKADADRFKGYNLYSIGADVFHGIGKRLNEWFGK